MIFRPPLEAYDVLIHLDKRQVSRRYVAVDAGKGDGAPRYVPLEEAGPETKRNMPVVDYDPTQSYLKELRVCKTFNKLNMIYNCRY